jgi:hypothetical protein
MPWPLDKALKKYNRSTMENARQLQCKALCDREKSRWRKNNGNNGKTMRRTMETVGNAGACLHRCDAGRPRRRCVRGRYPTEPGRISLQLNHALCGPLVLEKQTRPKRRAADARMSLCPLRCSRCGHVQRADPHGVSTTFCRSIWSGQKRTTDLQLGQLTERSPVVSIRRLGCPPGKRAF